MGRSQLPPLSSLVGLKPVSPPALLESESNHPLSTVVCTAAPTHSTVTMPATHAARSTTLDRPPSWGPRSDRTLHFHPPASNGAPHPVLPPHSAHYPQHLASLPSPQPRYSVQGQPPAPTYAAGHAATSYSHHHHHHHIAGAHQDAVGGMPVPPPSYSQAYTRLTSAPTSPQYARHRLPSSSNIEMKTAGATMASPGGSVSTSASPADPTSPSDRSEDMMRDSPSDRLGGSTGREVQRRQRNAEASARCRLKKRMKEKEDRHRYQEMEKQVQKLWSKLIIYETKNSEEAVKQLLEHRVPVDAMMPKLLTKVDRLIDENRYLRRKVGVDAERSAVS